MNYMHKLRIILLVLLITTMAMGCTDLEGQQAVLLDDSIFEGYELIEVDGGDLSGDREPNVVVDIGFGDREYYAFTNEYGQLVKVVASDIILQDDDAEPVLSTGRYFSDEAKVPGVESKTLDEGHIIADSLGGVSNAYNITPQNSTLNRHGDQAYMEDAIRKAGGCRNFEAIITYPDNETQIPSHYKFTYTLKGKVIVDEFDNINPDEANKALSIDSDVKIIELDKKLEYIILKNIGSDDINLKDWKLVSVRGDQTFIIPDFLLQAGETVKIGDSATNEDVNFHWLDGSGTWNNSKSDPAELYNDQDILMDRYDDN
ncbi:hypothetical protein EZV73_08905 [Acidaminobacter sp. JC074]|uniref:lamin tail domain-containing protein n=1 Tax=Acidaminobacter sp. JC074 TaxID=2530199 RepID=UPI001F0E8AFB|nr:lamin tail domain-containing protein [Acidaminobacter sp. JC074]MCH4887691.1 hypothetical protein [Acidaminobacter sp. JC074]